MTDKKSNDSRRKLLKSIAAGSGAVVAGKSLPESWSKPVINSVVLPAHAATTDDGSGNLPGEGTTEAPCNIAGSYCWTNEAGSKPRYTTIVVSADGSIEITEYRRARNNTWKGTGTASNGAKGGTFNIKVEKIGKVADSKDVRDYTGTIVCNSTSISGTWDNPRDPGDQEDPIIYEATQGNCPVLTEKPV